MFKYMKINLINYNYNHKPQLNNQNHKTFISTPLKFDTVSFKGADSNSAFKRQAKENLNLDLVEDKYVKTILAKLVDTNKQKPVLTTQEFINIISYFGYSPARANHGDHMQYINEYGYIYTVVNKKEADPSATSDLIRGLSYLNRTNGELIFNKSPLTEPELEQIANRTSEDIPSARLNKYRANLNNSHQELEEESENKEFDFNKSNTDVFPLLREEKGNINHIINEVKRYLRELEPAVMFLKERVNPTQQKDLASLKEQVAELIALKEKLQKADITDEENAFNLVQKSEFQRTKLENAFAEFKISLAPLLSEFKIEQQKKLNQASKAQSVKEQNKAEKPKRTNYYSNNIINAINSGTRRIFFEDTKIDFREAILNYFTQDELDDVAKMSDTKFVSEKVNEFAVCPDYTNAIYSFNFALIDEILSKSDFEPDILYNATQNELEDLKNQIVAGRKVLTYQTKGLTFDIVLSQPISPEDVNKRFEEYNKPIDENKVMKIANLVYKYCPFVLPDKLCEVIQKQSKLVEILLNSDVLDIQQAKLIKKIYQDFDIAYDANFLAVAKKLVETDPLNSIYFLVSEGFDENKQ